MSPHTTTLAAKQAATAAQSSHSLSFILTTFWLGLLSTTQEILGRSPSTIDEPKRSFPEGDLPEHGNGVAPPPLSNLDKNRRATPAFVTAYSGALDSVWREHDWRDVELLIATLQRCWRENRQVFLCGNGGSAANAIHLANDFLYGVGKTAGRGMRVIALPANPAVLTCLANDLAFEEIYAQQLSVLAEPGDLLLVLSGSGNSPNIVKALDRARELGVTSFAILGLTGGEALTLADHPIYFPVHDMQVAEDLQMMVGHMAMQVLARDGHK